MAIKEFSMQGRAENDLPSFVEVKEPISGLPMLFRNPALELVSPERTVVRCSDAESFALTVLEIPTANKLVELRNDGQFVYSDVLGAAQLITVRFTLAVCPTAPMLCLSEGRSFGQKALLQFVAQHPDCLLPQHPQGAAVMENLAQLEIKGSSNFQSVHTPGAISVSMERKKDVAGMSIPEFWTARSPLFHDHATMETTLRLEIVEPRLDDEGRAQGELAFRFELWTPDAEEVRDAAMADARERMAERLPELYVIRGMIETK